MSSRRLANYGCVIWGLCSVVYVTARAARLSFVHDESLSFLWAVHPRVPLSDVVTYRLEFPSNNHLLNSILMRLSLAIFGTNEFALRLPNVIAYVLFVLCSFLLVKRFHLAFTVFSSFVLLTANPFLLDFFGLARGYGLATSFLMISVLFLQKYFEKDRPGFKDKSLPFFFAALSVLSNIAFLNYYFALFGVFILVEAWLFFSEFQQNLEDHPVRSSFKEIWPSCSVTILLLMMVLPTLLKWRATGELYEGGKTGFFPDTIVSLVRNSLYSEMPLVPLEKVLSYVVVLLSFCTLAAVFWFIYKNKLLLSKRRLSTSFLMVFVTLFAAASSIAQHHLLNINFLRDRTAILFLPLFVLCLGVLFDDLIVVLSPKDIPWSALHIALTILLVGTLVNFVSRANLSHTLIWKYDAETKNFMNDLIEFHDRQVTADPNLVNRRLKLGINWLFEPTVNFYIVNKNLGWLNFADRTGVASKDYDYYFYNIDDGPLLATRPIIQVKAYRLTGNIFGYRFPVTTTQ